MPDSVCRVPDQRAEESTLSAHAASRSVWGARGAVEQIRFCLASPSFFPTYGGAQLRFLRYLPGLTERGIDPYVLTGTPTLKEIAGTGVMPAEWTAHRFGHLFPVEKLNGAPIHRVQLPDKKGWRRMITFNQALLGACRQPESRPDIVQLVTNLRPRAIPWLIRLRMLGIPTVYAVTLAPINTSKKLSKRILRQLSWRQLYNRLDCIITNNETLRDMVRGFGVTTPIEVIPNGVDLKRFYPQPGGSDRNRVRVSLGIGASDPVICTVGAVIPRKGTDVLVEAWLNVLRRFPRTHLLVIGPQTHLEHPKLGWFRSRIENAVRKSGMPKRIHFTGIVDDVAAHLRASDIFVLASDLEGMPNSVLEAMATSLPVIMTPFVGLSQDLGTPGRHFFLSQKDIDALAKHLEELLENREYRLQLGERGRQWVTDTLDIESSLDQYASLYHELVLRTRANTAT